MKDKDDLLRHMIDRMNSAVEKRPDVPSEDLLFSLFGKESVSSVQDVNDADEPMVFACMRVVEAPMTCVVSGSTKKRCPGCNEEVWMSPGTEATMRKIRKPMICCLNCLPKGNE